MRTDDHYTPPASPMQAEPARGRKPLGPWDILKFILPALVCMVTSIVPVMFNLLDPLFLTGLVGLPIGAILCVVTGVRFGECMNPGRPFLGAILWTIIVTATNFMLALAGCVCVVALNAL